MTTFPLDSLCRLTTHSFGSSSSSSSHYPLAFTNPITGSNRRGGGATWVATKHLHKNPLLRNNNNKRSSSSSSRQQKQFRITFLSMCRWITYLSSDRISLHDLVLAPSQSLVQMSIDASFHPGHTVMNNHQMNGDGFGVAWYYKKQNSNGGPEEQQAAAVFKDVLPAWNNMNLREICQATTSDCILAHVRAASPSTGVSPQNCHPFKAGRLLFCHNGRIQNFIVMRRKMQNLLSDEAHQFLRGTTDSENIFALILTLLANDGMGPSNGGVSPILQETPFGHKRLTAAIKNALHHIDNLVWQCGLQDGFNTCNFSLTDGDTVVATRYCSKSPDIPPPSLYFAFGDAHELHYELTHEDEALLPPMTNESGHSAYSAEPNVVSVGETTTTANGHDGGHRNNSNVSSTPGDVLSSDTDSDVEPVPIKYEMSKPGQILADIDTNQACLVVCSIPLTKTHAWHRLPDNSILWYNRGSFPELRLLRSKARTETRNVFKVI